MPNWFLVSKFVGFADKDRCESFVDKMYPTEYKRYDQSRADLLSFCPGPNQKHAPTLINPMGMYLQSSYQPGSVAGKRHACSWKEALVDSRARHVRKEREK